MLVDFKVTIEKFFQFDLRPVVKRISESRTERFAICDEFIVIARAARYQFFRYAVIAHQPPFVVIAAEPDFGDIVKPFVFQNLLFRKVAMIVENRHIFRVSFVKFYRRFVFKKKIIL